VAAAPLHYPAAVRLPVEDVLPELLAACREPGAAVVTAPPGSGKTTALPPALLAVVSGKILVLQPRRAAARLAARRVASVRGESVGGVVGYATRFERRRGPKTRIEFLTEGLLLRRLQADPLLDGVGAVLLDEFHERSLAADVGLAQLRELRELRPELVVLVLSATLDAGPVAAFLGAPVIQASGRSYPVAVEYAPPARGRIEPQVATAVRRALAEEPAGHVLAFLPGAGEIARTAGLLRGVDAEVLPLHGGLSAAAQDRALAPSRRRKVVLSTNLAETSVTLEGVAVVVDSGLVRQARWDPALAATRLELLGVSQASADQRAGRAGRTGPGRCIRLWAAGATRRAFDAPEITRADLTDTVLALREQGIDPRTLQWLQAPSESAVAAAEQELTELGALDGSGVTPLGRALAGLPLPPRLGVCLLAGREHGSLMSVATALALLVERDPFRQAPPEAHREGSGLLGRLVALAGDRGPIGRVADQLIHRAEAAPRVTLPPPPTTADCPPLEAALLTGLRGRIARRRGRDADEVVFAAGGAAVMGPETVAPSELVLALRVQAGPRGRAPWVRLATPLSEQWLQPTDSIEAGFDEAAESVVARRRRRLGALILTEQPAKLRDGPDVAAALLAAASKDPEAALSPSDSARQLRARVRWLAARRPELDLPALDWADALPALVPGRRSFAQLRQTDLGGALRGCLTWNQRQELDRLAPTSVTLPTGRTRKLTYDEEGPPVLAARIQQLFGLADGPRVDGGRCPVRLHLLAPNQRPAQVTDDLAGFWDGSYADVRKDLRGRYPKHPWPEDPRHAPATDRAKRRK